MLAEVNSVTKLKVELKTEVSGVVRTLLKNLTVVMGKSFTDYSQFEEMLSSDDTRGEDTVAIPVIEDISMPLVGNLEEYGTDEEIVTNIDTVL